MLLPRRTTMLGRCLREPPMSTTKEKKGDCPLCQEKDQVLLRSHLIPDSFTASLTKKGTKQQQAYLLDQAAIARSARPGGIYQEHFLCGECERRLGVWDDYTGGVFFRDVDAWKPVRNPSIWTMDHGEPEELRGWQLDVDVDKLLLFFYSFLWRAHATDRKEFAAFDLAEHAEHFRQVSLTGTLPAESPLEIVLIRYERSERLPGIETAWSFSDAGLLDGRHGYAFDFGGWRAFLKIDGRPFSPVLQQGTVRIGRPLFALSLPFDGSRADQQLRQAAKDIAQAESERSVRNASTRLERVTKMS
jgi:hypothetical protein